MTIAIGIIASDGILVATDREANDTVQKLDEGKAKGSYVNASPYNSLLIAGAGRGSYIDAVTTSLLDSFRNLNTSSLPELEREIATQNKKFYKDYVLPLSRYPSEERPDYQLLIAGKLEKQSALWTSDALVLNHRDGYAAIGVGSMAALTLLRTLYAYIPLVNAICLAIYIVQEVKRLVPGCGLDTDVLYAPNNHEPDKLVGPEVREIENMFRLFSLLQREHFHLQIGSDLSRDPRTKSHQVTTQGDKVRAFFEETNERLEKRIKDRNKF